MAVTKFKFFLCGALGIEGIRQWRIGKLPFTICFIAY
jgi:hypothetical protein